MSIEYHTIIHHLFDSGRPRDDLEATRQEIRSKLGQLDEDYRTVLVLRFISGLTAEETGAVMGKSPTAIRGLQRRALTALRNLLDI